MSKQSFRDLKNEIELKNAEIDELSMEFNLKNELIYKSETDLINIENKFLVTEGETWGEG